MYDIYIIQPKVNFRSRIFLKEGFSMYTIGQVSTMFDLPVSTLRYYDKEGFFPNLERKGNIRYFSDNELEALRIIECLKKSGLGFQFQQLIFWFQIILSFFHSLRCLQIPREKIALYL